MPRKTSKRQVKRRTKRKTMQRKRRKQFGGDDVFSAGQKVFYKNPELTKKGQYDIESAEVIEIKDGKMNIKIENSKITGRIGKTYEVNSENIQHSIDLGDFLDATKSDQVGGGNLINADNSQYSGGFGSNMGAVAGCVGCDGCGGQKGGGDGQDDGCRKGHGGGGTTAPEGPEGTAACNLNTQCLNVRGPPGPQRGHIYMSYICVCMI